MGSYSNSRQRKKSGASKKIGLVLVFAMLVMATLCLVAPKFAVSKFFLGTFGLIFFPMCLFGVLLGLAMYKNFEFTMERKNAVYLGMSVLCLALLLHTIFSGAILNSLKVTDYSAFGEYLKHTYTQTYGITVGGVVLGTICYLFIGLIGKIASSIVFAIGLVVFLSLTIDYYINIKSFYEASLSRKNSYARNETNYLSSAQSGDTIASGLQGAEVGEAPPTKTRDSSYVGLYSPDAKTEDNAYNFSPNSIIDDNTGEPKQRYTEPEPEDNLSPTEKAMKVLYGGADYASYKKEEEEPTLALDEKANSKFDTGKFSSPNEYINYKYSPKLFDSPFDDKKQDADAGAEPEDNYFAPTANLLDDAESAEEETESGDADSSAFTTPNTSAFDFLNNTSAGDEEAEPEEEEVPENNAFNFSTLGNLDAERTERRQSIPRENLSRQDYTSRRQENFGINPRRENEQLKMPIMAKPKFYIQEKDYKYNAPPTSLLENNSDDISTYGGNYEQRSRDLEQVLSSFKIDAKVSAVTRGPAVTQYELTMPFGVSVKRILGFDSDIAAAMRSKNGVRIEAPILGKNAVGVEVPNDVRSKVGLRELLESKEFTSSTAALPVAIGKNISGEVVVKSLPKMVHLLIAGATGSGKSIFMHSLILGLMFKSSPKQLRFIIIDPKRVEFSGYSGMPHMMLPNTVCECDKAINALGWAVKEMERRYDLLKEHAYQNIEDFNHSSLVKNGEEEQLPYIVIVIDELAELMMVGKREVEEKIQRIAQLGRASGIHMVIATQRPSTDVVTGTIKNNLPTRIAFSLSSYVDSRTILDEGGAEKLLGAGDMLLSAQDSNVNVRLQGGFMTMDEVRRVIKYIKENNECYFDEEIEKEIMSDKKEEVQVDEGSNDRNNNDFDELMPQALKLCMDTGGASINMIQRRFRVGYARAARIIDQMELAGFISPGNGSKLRTVYITNEQFEEMFGNKDDIPNGY